MDDIFAQYYEDLLRAQYRVSELVQQNLPKGTIREDFLRDLILKQKESLRGKKGVIIKNGVQSGECDLVFYDVSAAVNPLGDLIVIEPKYCKLIVEVKSNATGTDLKKTNDNFQKIKSIDPNNPPLGGLFCYNTILKKKTIFNRFGWVFDNDLEAWEEDQTRTLIYPNIDFIINIACIEEEGVDCTEKQFFLIKDDVSNRYISRAEYPIIKNFFSLTDNL